jgi:high-affinity nickel permease
MTILASLLLGLGLGLRHATDADHVVVLTGLVQRERGIVQAARVAIAWGLGHGLTFFAMGLAIVLLGLRLPVAFEPAMELVVAAMLIAMGTWHIARVGTAPVPSAPAVAVTRPLVVGLVHGLAGSAPIALMALATMPSRMAAAAFLVLFAVGTVLGMVAFTALLARPLAWALSRPAIERVARIGAGALSVLMGFAIGLEHVMGR